MRSDQQRAPVLARWNRELVKVLSATDVKAQLDKHGLTAAPGTREDLAKVIDDVESLGCS